MKQNFPDPIPDSSFDSEEIVIGIHSSGVQLEEGLNTSNSRNYCSNCKKKIHCFVKVDRETKEAIIHKTCKSSDCACKCRTHFACKQCGYLHPYGQKCNRTEILKKIDPKSDEEFNKIMDEWREEQDAKITNIKPKGGPI